MEDEKIILIFTDGSCFNQDIKNKPESRQLTYGANAIIIVEVNNEFKNPNVIHEEASAEFDTTNNRMEIKAFLKALQWIKTYISKNRKNIKFIIASDSLFVIKSLLYYMKKWSSNGWKKSDGSTVKNLELFQECYKLFYEELSGVNIEMKWVKSHSNKNDIFSLYNGIVDLKARETAKNYKEENKEEYEKLNKEFKVNFVKSIIKEIDDSTISDQLEIYTF